MQTVRVRVNASGRFVIPAEVRREMGIKGGDQLVLEVKDQVMQVMTLRHRVEQAQALVQRYIPAGGASLSEELIAERREEAKRE